MQIITSQNTATENFSVGRWEASRQEKVANSVVRYGVTDTFCIRAAMGLALHIHVILLIACLTLVTVKAATNKLGKI